jgi:excisionase family DNA binding protein
MVGRRAYRVAEVAALIGSTESSIRSMIRRGQLPVSRIGTRLFVHAEDLDTFIRSRGLRSVPEHPRPVTSPARPMHVPSVDIDPDLIREAAVQLSRP